MFWSVTVSDVHFSSRQRRCSTSRSSPQYTDDMQLYVALRPSDVSPFDAVSLCVSDISRWFLENWMLINPSKNEAVLFGTRAQRKQINTSAGIDVAGIKVAFSCTVKLLGVTLDEDLSLDRHVSQTSFADATITREFSGTSDRSSTSPPPGWSHKEL